MLFKSSIQTQNRIQFIDITSEIKRYVKQAKIESGIAVIFVPHTTAGITINENADPSVKSDINAFMSKLIPQNLPYFRHMEGNSDSHIKSSLFSASLTVIIENFSLLLGTWQSIYFCEFDGPRNRKFFIKLLKTVV